MDEYRMGKVLVITGASRGIGLATAKIFQANGYSVVNISRSPIDPNIGTQLSADLSDASWIHSIEDKLVENVSNVEQIALVHNAAILLKDSIQAASEEFARIMQVNVIAAQQLNEMLLPKMKPGSSIHYVGSTLSEKAVANTLTYSTSKHATLGLMRASCQDLMGTGIHTTCVCPGFTDTEMLRDHVGNDSSVLEVIGSANGFDRLALPKEIAETLFFAAQNPVLNGSVLHANLGQRES